MNVSLLLLLIIRHFVCVFVCVCIRRLAQEYTLLFMPGALVSVVLNMSTTLVCLSGLAVTLTVCSVPDWLPVCAWVEIAGLALICVRITIVLV